MLTWAIVFLYVRLAKSHDGFNGLHLAIAMGCDVAIFYYISEAAAHWCK